MLEIRRVQQEARASGKATRPRWPMIVLRTPKGWTGPQEVDGHKVEGFWRSHQVPLSGMHDNPAHLKQLEEWLRSYKPRGAVRRRRAAHPRAARARAQGHAPHGRQPARQRRRCCASRCACRTSATTPSRSTSPGRSWPENTRPLGQFLRDIMRDEHDELPRLRPRREHARTASTPIYEVSKKLWLADYLPEDADGGELAPDGRVLEMLSRAHAGGLARRRTCSPAGTASSPPTKPSPTSSTRCSTCTPSGWP